nr:MAG TPA: hypothetical protein [Caudoviricetes sp.]
MHKLFTGVGGVGSARTFYAVKIVDFSLWCRVV